MLEKYQKEVKLKKVPFVVNCEQLNLDVEPDKSWVLEKLDNECYVEKLIRLALELELFSCVILLVPDLEIYEVYHQFKSDTVLIEVCDQSDYRLRTQDIDKTWNVFVPYFEVSAVWTYKLCKKLNVDFVFSMDIYCLLPDRNTIIEALDFVSNNLDNYLIIKGAGCIQALIFPVKYLEKHYYADTSIDKLKCLDFKGFELPRKCITSKLVEKYSNIKTNFLSFARKEGFILIRNFFRQKGVNFDLSDASHNAFYRYLNVHYHLIRDLPKVVCLNLDEKFVENDFLIILQKLEKIGKITVKVRLKQSFTHWLELENSLKSHNLHYILQTDGICNENSFQSLLELVDMIEFDLPDYNFERLALENPSKNIDTLHNNFMHAIARHSRMESPQVGIICILPNDKLIQLDILKYWFHRIDFSYPTSSFHIIGDLNPKVQYIKYYHSEQERLKEEIQSGELIIDDLSDSNKELDTPEFYL